ncbi:MAG: 2-oxoisovalerate dehydrogenase [Acidobacteriota bacterium]
MNELIFLVEEDPEGGFTARALGESIFTEGESWEEVKKKVQEAVECHFEGRSDRPGMVRLHLVRDEVMAL